MNSRILYILLFVLFTGTACKKDKKKEDETWLIPQEEVRDGGPGKDGIPALANPTFINAVDATYLSATDLVVGYVSGSMLKAYPHDILDWHEIINDDVNGEKVSIVYCPLTGTGTGWEGEMGGSTTTYGVSGLLYNSNIIPYDRESDSNWSQMRLDCVNGDLIGSKADVFQVIETTWETWQEMYPLTTVVSDDTDHDRAYGVYPYGDYKTNHDNIIFPVSNSDARLSNKERVLGLLVDGAAKTYRLSSFPGALTVVDDSFQSTELVIAGSEDKNFIVAFERNLSDGTALTFEAVPDSLPTLLKDNEGNRWDAFGNNVSGPRTGQTLTPTTSFMGYWFAWAAFYPDVAIFE